MNSPFFSIICPMFNSAKFVERTIQSVIAQTFQDFELILIDDGSSDNTCEVIEAIIQQYPARQIKLLRNNHLGPGAARNVGIRTATAEWIAFLDSDDVWVPEKLARVYDVIIKNAEINFICHGEEHVYLDSTKNVLYYGDWYNSRAPLARQLYYRNLFSTSAVVCTKPLLMKGGLFDEHLMSAQDYELWLRLSEHIRVQFINKTLGYYYDRKGNISSQKQLRRLINILKIYVRYRKKSGWVLCVRQLIITVLFFLVQFTRSLYAKHCKSCK